MITELCLAGLVVLSVVGPSHSASTSQPRAGMCGRGLPAPCAVTCTLSTRLCRACCAAVASFSETTDKPEEGGSDQQGVDNAQLLQERDKAIREASRCLAVCSSLSAKKIKDAMENPDERREDLESLADELSKLSSDPWLSILQNAYNSRPFNIAQLCKNKLSC